MLQIQNIKANCFRLEKVELADVEHYTASHSKSHTYSFEFNGEEV